MKLHPACRSALLIVGSVAALSSCAKHSTSVTAPSGATSGTNYTITQSISDEAQRNTIAFDGLAFLNGSVGSQSFLPPGKVADYSGFQYLRDNDPTDMGHNTDFVTIIAANVLNILTPAQIDQLVASAKVQIGLINEFAYQRYPLLDAFRRNYDRNLPAGTTGLDSAAVVAYTAQLYQLDGRISYGRARIMGSILRSLSTPQQQAFAALEAKNGVGNWNRSLPDPLQARALDPDVNVAVMTYASEMYAWYAGTVESDTYFCPERHGTYFGSFYLKDWPAMGNPNYAINEQLTASAGQNFLAALSPAQAALVTGIVDVQRVALNEMVARRRDVSTLLREFQAGLTPDSASVIALSARYGALDGALSYTYASRFAAVAHGLSTAQRAHLDSLALQLGYTAPPGGFLYSQPVAMPAYENTDFLFGKADTIRTTSFRLTSSAVSDGGDLPADYTCDGTSATLPLAWSGAPASTQNFALVMHHLDPQGMVKWYWILYDIPASVASLPRNVTGIGTVGGNSENTAAAYAPPCSQGPGPKTYVVTLYALSAAPVIAVPPAGVTPDLLGAAIADRTVDSTSLSFVYSRP